MRFLLLALCLSGCSVAIEFGRTKVSEDVEARQKINQILETLKQIGPEVDKMVKERLDAYTNEYRKK